MMAGSIERRAVVIVGGGPAGLAAAIAAYEAGETDVLILERDTQLGGDDLRCCDLTGDQDGELVTTDASECVVAPQAAPKAGADRTQQLITGRMPEAVVDLLEIVDIDEDQHERPVPDCVIQPLRQQ